MIRRMFVAAAGAAIAAGALIGAGAVPAGAFTLKSTATTLTVTLTDTSTVDITVLPNGDVEVVEGVSAPVVLAGKLNLVVNAFDAPSTLTIRFESTLNDSLTVNLPSDNDLTLASDVSPAVFDDVKIVGSDDANQQVRLGAGGDLFQVGGNLHIDLGRGNDQLVGDGVVHVLGGLKTAGIDTATFNDIVQVQDKMNISTRAEKESATWTANGGSFEATDGFTFNGGPGNDTFTISANTVGYVGGNAKFNLGTGDLAGSQDIVLANTIIVRALTIRGGEGFSNNLFTNEFTQFQNRVTVRFDGQFNSASFQGTNGWAASALTYTGADDGSDVVELLPNAPNLKATLNLKGGDDTLITDPGLTAVKLLTANFGAGADTFTDNGYTPPVGSKITGLP